MSEHIYEILKADDEEVEDEEEVVEDTSAGDMVVINADDIPMNDGSAKGGESLREQPCTRRRSGGIRSCTVKSRSARYEGTGLLLF